MILGIHGSVLRGFGAALKEAADLGCQALQMLPYRRHHEPEAAEIDSFREARESGGVMRLLIHSRFVPSLASSDQSRRRSSVEKLARELALSGRLGGEAYVLHAGAYSPEGDSGRGLRLAAESIREAWERAAVPIPIYLENVPGGGRRLGGRLEELETLLGLLGRVPSAVCLDTAHAWAAGYDLGSAEGMYRFLSRAHRLLGADRVKAFHLNDTRALLGSRREQHSHWGEGFIASEALKALLERPEYREAVGIIETPKGEGRDGENLEFVRQAAVYIPTERSSRTRTH
ncbi:MAG: deoxyribonuclease IV [Elusimicrobia bacterium]|nr:deoxyribonuclease IV [Elusimicrobiota bacterium]